MCPQNKESLSKPSSPLSMTLTLQTGHQKKSMVEQIQSVTTRTQNTGAMPATKTVNTGFTVTLPYNAVGNITGGGENIYVSPMIRGIL